MFLAMNFANMSKNKGLLCNGNSVPLKAENGAEEDIAPQAYSTETTNRIRPMMKPLNRCEEARGERFEDNEERKST